jgi:hypothetical protein
LFTEHPGNRIDDVGFTAPIWANDTGQSGPAKGQVRLLAKGLESNKLDSTQFEQETPVLPPRIARYGKGGDEFAFLERRVGAATTLAGRLPVAQPSGAWIGGLQAHNTTASAKL